MIVIWNNAVVCINVKHQSHSVRSVYGEIIVGIKKHTIVPKRKTLLYPKEKHYCTQKKNTIVPKRKTLLYPKERHYCTQKKNTIVPKRKTLLYPKVNTSIKK